MSFNGNQIEDIVEILLPKTFYWHSKWNKNNGIFLQNSEYDQQILHKKLV